MIARIWHGKTSLDNFEAYTQFLIDRAVPDYKQTKGFVRLDFLKEVKTMKVILH